MKKNKQKILLIDQHEDVLKLAKNVLSRVGFFVITTNNLKDIFALVAKEKPHIIMIDAELPGTIGFDITKKLKNDIVTYHIPVIIMTTLEDEDFANKAIQAGADDFLVKPLDPKTILAKIQLVLQRLARERFCNPLTELAGNVFIENKIEQHIKDNVKFAVCFADISRFRQYNLKYGFEKGDEVIKNTGKIINMVLRRFPCHDCFLGHLGGDHFVFITPLDIVENICSRIIESFDETVPGLYNASDLNRGYIQLKNRTGKIEKASLLTLSISVVANQHRTIDHMAMISDIAKELRKYAKSFTESIFVIDRRTESKVEKQV